MRPRPAARAPARALALAGVPAAVSAVLALLGSPALAATVRHWVLTAADGNVSARLTYDERTRFGLPQDSKLKLSITRAGTTAFAAPPGTGSPPCGRGDAQCTVARGYGGSLAVRDVEGDGEPDVLLSLYTGGAHCCSVMQVYAWDPAASVYRLTEHNFGDPGARLTDLSGDGRLEFLSADDRFAYAFSAYAFSGLPIQIWRFSGHRFLDVTRSFPVPVAADAQRQYRYFLANARRRLGLGFIAAWAADEDLLGHQALVAATLSDQLRAGRLRSVDAHAFPGGARFVSRLQRLLHHDGYSGP